MKIECTDCGGLGEVPLSNPPEKCDTCGWKGYIEVTVTTEQLISELEKRSPDCGNCKNNVGGDEPCMCIWNCRVDNFKEGI